MNDITLFNDDNFSKAIKISQTLAKSSLIPSTLRGKAADIFTILAMGNELGIAPMTALNSINVIQGKPTIAPQLMIALVRSKLPDCFIKIEVDEDKKTVKCITARDKKEQDDSYTATWDMKKATSMGLANKDNYKKQPINMLKWRAVSESFRVTFPDILKGLYISEELEHVKANEPQAAYDSEDFITIKQCAELKELCVESNTEEKIILKYINSLPNRHGDMESFEEIKKSDYEKAKDQLNQKLKAKK